MAPHHDHDKPRVHVPDFKGGSAGGRPNSSPATGEVQYAGKRVDQVVVCHLDKQLIGTQGLAGEARLSPVGIPCLQAQCAMWNPATNRCHDVEAKEATTSVMNGLIGLFGAGAGMPIILALLQRMTSPPPADERSAEEPTEASVEKEPDAD